MELPVGGNGYGNNEQQTYTDRLENVRVENGHLAIEARKENLTGSDGIPRSFTSGRLKTLGKFSQQYGKFEARIKIPAGQGIWPAFWMMGADKDLVGCPACGEIDMMENIGREPATVRGTAHGPGSSGGSGIGSPYQLPPGQRFSDDYHVFSVEWKPNWIQWKVDGNVYHTLIPDRLPAGAPWAFNSPFFILLNVTPDRAWPGYPDASPKSNCQTRSIDASRKWLPPTIGPWQRSSGGPPSFTSCAFLPPHGTSTGNFLRSMSGANS